MADIRVGCGVVVRSPGTAGASQIYDRVPEQSTSFQVAGFEKEFR